MIIPGKSSKESELFSKLEFRWEISKFSKISKKGKIRRVPLLLYELFEREPGCYEMADWLR